MPLAVSDGAVVASAGDADGTTFLLAAADAVGEGGRDGHVINLRGGLVVPGAPGCAVVDGDQRTLITD